MILKNKLLFLIVTIQILFFAGWYYLENNKLSNPKARTILVKTIPVDPRDLISGNYLTLHYEFNNFWRFKNREKKIQELMLNEVYAVLKKENQYYVPDYITTDKPLVRDDQVVIKGNYSQITNNIDYGVEKYFISENLKEPSREDKIEVELLIGDDFTARIKTVLVNGM